MKKKALLTRFGERYICIEHDGGYLLYDKEGKAKRAQALFKGHFYLSSSGNKYIFHEEFYDTPEALIQAMEEWAKTLPFNVEIYNPSYKKNYTIECALQDYLISLGFTYSWGKYILSDHEGKEMCLLEIEVEDDKTSGAVTRFIGDGSWQDAKFTDLDSAIGACNILLSTYCLVVNAKVTALMSKMSNHRVSSFFHHTFNMKTLSFYSEDAKRKAIEQLEAELKRLKEE